MIKKLLFGIALFGISYLASAQQSQLTNAEITFEFVAKKVKGQIAGFQSESKLDWQNLENSVLKGSVAVKTLDTNNGLRNWSLKSGKYFDEDDHPRIHFESKSVKLNGDMIAVSGILRLKGIEKPLDITFKRTGNVLVGTASLYTTDFDVKIKKKREDNLVTITFRFELS